MGARIVPAASAFPRIKSWSSLESTTCPFGSSSTSPRESLQNFADIAGGRSRLAGFSRSHVRVSESSRSHSSLMFTLTDTAFLFVLPKLNSVQTTPDSERMGQSKMAGVPGRHDCREWDLVVQSTTCAVAACSRMVLTAAAAVAMSSYASDFARVSPAELTRFIRTPRGSASTSSNWPGIGVPFTVGCVDVRAGERIAGTNSI